MIYRKKVKRDEIPGKIIYEDEFQIAKKNPGSDVRITTKAIG